MSPDSLSFSRFLKTSGFEPGPSGNERRVRHPVSFIVPVWSKFTSEVEVPFSTHQLTYPPSKIFSLLTPEKCELDGMDYKNENNVMRSTLYLNIEISTLLESLVRDEVGRLKSLFLKLLVSPIR